MQSLDTLIVETWNQLKPRLLSNPEELARRLKRRNSRTFSRPPRAWCLAIRACDRRIGVINGNIDPEYATDPADPDHLGRVVEHTVTLTAELVRKLCCPVTLNPAGELHDAAAKKLGVTRQGLTSARITGALHTRHIKGLLGRHGHIPVLSTRKRLDPCAGRDFHMPHPLWIGTEYVSARVPSDLSQTIKRIPVYESTRSKRQFDPDTPSEFSEPPSRRERKRLPPPEPDYVWYKWSKSGQFLGEDPRYWRKSFADPGTPPPQVPPKPRRPHKPHPSQSSGSIVFRGWRWICPRCNQKVRTLYLPAPPECVLKDEFRRMKDENGIGNRAAELLSSLGLPPSSFACKQCHRIRDFSSIARNSWNDLISTLSGGLLRGKDIPKPAWFAETAQRRIAYRPRLRAAPRRQLLLDLVLQGDPAKQIAEKMHLQRVDVTSRIFQLCKQEQVPNRMTLAKKHGRDPTAQPDRSGAVRARRGRVLELLVAGLKPREIAVRMRMKQKAVKQDIFRMCRKMKVNQAGLIATFLRAEDNCEAVAGTTQYGIMSP